MALPRRSRRIQGIKAEQLSWSPELSLQRRQAEHAINLDSEPTADASAVEPGEQLRGDQDYHRSTTPVSSAGQEQAEDVIGSYSESIVEPLVADGSLLIEDPSSAIDGPTEEQAGSPLRKPSILSMDALSLLEANEAPSEGGTPHVKDATGSSASPHPSASKIPSRQSPCSPPSTIMKPDPELPEGENAIKRNSSEEQAEGYSVSPPMGQLLDEGKAISPSPQEALLSQEELVRLVCWWLQVFGSLHSLGNKIFR